MLSFGEGSADHGNAKVAVLLGSALIATVILRVSNRVYRRIYEEENRDVDNDGIPDVHQVDQPRAGRSG